MLRGRFARVVLACVVVPAVASGAMAACGRVVDPAGVVDPAAPDFLLGAAVGNNGGVDLQVVECGGGTLRTLGVSRIEADKSRTPLWKIDAGALPGVVFAPAQAQTLTIGSPPAGMSESTPLAAPLPREQQIAVSVNFTTKPDASVGFFFMVNDLEPGRVWVESGKKLSQEEFLAEAKKVCQT